VGVVVVGVGVFIAFQYVKGVFVYIESDTMGDECAHETCVDSKP